MPTTGFFKPDFLLTGFLVPGFFLVDTDGRPPTGQGFRGFAAIDERNPTFDETRFAAINEGIDLLGLHLPEVGDIWDIIRKVFGEPETHKPTLVRDVGELSLSWHEGRVGRVEQLRGFTVGPALPTELSHKLRLTHNVARKNIEIALEGINFGDLLDVTLINEQNNQVAVYQNGIWVNQFVPVTASNIGVGGIGFFERKVGNDLQFRNLNIGSTGLSSKLALALDAPNFEVDLTLDQIFLDDLADVRLTAAFTGQVLVKDISGFWENDWVAANAANIGGGEVEWFKQKVTDTFEFRTLNAGTNLSAVLGDAVTLNWAANFDDLTDVNVTTPVDGEIVTRDGSEWIKSTIANTGTGAGLYKGYDAAGNAHEFKGLVEGANITLTAGADGITIAGAAVGEVNLGANVGSLGFGPFDGKSGVTLNFRNIAANSSKIAVSLDDALNNIEIDLGTVNFDDLADVTISTPTEGQVPVYDAGAPSLWKNASIVNVGGATNAWAGWDDAAKQLEIRTFGSSSHNTVNLASDVISFDWAGDTLDNDYGDETITSLFTFSRGASAPFAVASPTAATVFNLDADLLDTFHGTSYARLLSSAGGTESLVNDANAAPDSTVRVKGLTAGTGITLTPSATDITITSTAGGGETNTASNLSGGDFGWFKSKVGVDLQFRSVKGGANIALSVDGGDSFVTADVSPQGIGSLLDADFVDGRHETDFILVDGTRELTGDWDAGAFNIEAEGFDAVSSVNAILQATNYNDVSALQARLVLRKARGTEGAPTAVGASTIMARLQSQGHDGTAFQFGPELQFRTTEAWTGAARGSEIRLYTIADGTTPQSHRLTLQQDGTLNSKVAGGTAPFESTTSTTLCPNLNADLLDGFHGTSYARLLVSAGGDQTLVNDGDAAADSTLRIKGLTVGSGGLSVNNDTSFLTLDNTLTGSNITGGSQNVFIDKVGDTLRFRSLLNGNGITMALDTDRIEFNFDGANIGAGQADVLVTPVGAPASFRSFLEGPGIDITENPNDITIASDAPNNVEFAVQESMTIGGWRTGSQVELWEPSGITSPDLATGLSVLRVQTNTGTDSWEFNSAGYLYIRSFNVHVPSNVKSGSTLKVFWRWFIAVTASGTPAVHWRLGVGAAGATGSVSDLLVNHDHDVTLATDEAFDTIHTDSLSLTEGVDFDAGDILSVWFARESTESYTGATLIIAPAWVEYTKTNVADVGSATVL